ncbi:MAG: hypothetical protein ACRCR4_08430 [Thiotrichaceae bacterium]|uniref:Uncharacterized protein n=1 Tax=Candidatus Thiocaldithrix dubininis TaxID=3080823 RepID=A0AA95H9G9_9GAMM|nr:MAG: hypothetical protein QJT80_13835 [Candidatus Thiocaldithrix dubininis]
MDRELIQLLVVLLIGLGLGSFVVQRWHKQDFPQQALYMEIKNTRDELIPLVKIEHGSDFLQERILLTQLRPGESRMITLNHEPGKGYSVEAQLKNNDKIEACVGKLSIDWVDHIEIGNNGVNSVD